MITLDRFAQMTLPRCGRHPVGLGVALVLSLGTLGAPSPCRAGLELVVEDSAPDATGAGAFDVTIRDDDPAGTAPFQLSGFSIELAAPTGSAVTFQDANEVTAAPYVFGADGLGSLFPDPTNKPFPSQDFIASDLYLGLSGYQSINPGGTFGLAHVTYSVTPGSVGPVTVSFKDLGGGTSLSGTDPLGNEITVSSFSANDGTISPVPEPATLAMLGTAGVVALISRAILRRRGA